jgi:uncharacterized membrane protein
MGNNHAMDVNLNASDRVVRGVIGAGLLAVGLLAGRRSWWGAAMDLTGAVLLLSATTGFCHIYKTLGVCSLENGD